MRVPFGKFRRVGRPPSAIRMGCASPLASSKPEGPPLRLELAMGSFWLVPGWVGSTPPHP